MVRRHTAALRKRVSRFPRIILTLAGNAQGVIAHPYGLFYALMFVLLAASGGNVAAASYGGSAYGACAYQSSCVPSTQVTVPTPSSAAPDLNVSINLGQGQTLPAAGYTIVITPLNGMGVSFKQADFYINGAYVHTQVPEDDGTVRWRWQPNGLHKADIKVIVVAQDGTTASQSFTVTIAAKDVAFLMPVTPTVGQSLPAQLVQQGERAIRQLPPPVKYTIPYFLFALLAGDVLFVLYNVQREVRASRLLQHLLQREREINELKKTFVALVSHYLRTPLAIVKGGVDLLGSLGGTPETVANLQADMQVLGSTIDGLISERVNKLQPVVGGADVQKEASSSTWRNPLLLLPVVMSGALAFSFDYLAQHAGSFSLGQINLIVQVALFVSLSVLMYVLFRELFIQRRTSAAARKLLDEEVSFDAARDELIDASARELTEALGQLDAHVAAVGATDATKFLQQGTTQLRDVAYEFSIARELKGSSAASAPKTTSLREVAGPALQITQEKAAAKGVSIALTKDTALNARRPDLLATVVRSALDNAVDYSPQGASVEVTAVTRDQTAVLQIADHGQGIPEDKQFALFQAFARVEGAEVFNREGMGFSLYLDRLIMRYLGGDIAISTTEPHGTTVTITLPQ